MGLIKAGMGALAEPLQTSGRIFLLRFSGQGCADGQGPEAHLPPQLQQRRGQYHHQRQRHCCGRRTVHAHRGAGPRGGGVRRTGRIHL